MNKSLFLGDIIMNICELANNIMSKEESEELNRAIALQNNNSEEFYKKYQKLIENIIFVTSQNEYMDFIREENSLNKNIFILEFLSSKNYCINIGGYEENADSKIIDFFYRKKIKLTNTFIKKNTNIAADIDNNQNFKNYLTVLNNELNRMGFEICVLFHDIYCEGVYTLFVYNRKFSKKIWNELENNDISIYFKCSI